MGFECQKGTKSLRIGSIEHSENRENLASEKRKSLYKLDANGGIMNSKCEELLTVNEVLSDCRSITELPPALISEIFNCIEPKELGIVSCACTLLYRIASEHHLWKEFYCERWGEPMLLSDEKSWKELFVEREFRSKNFMGRYTVDMLYGHIEDVRTVFVLSSKKLVFTSGYDQIVRMWNLEEGLLLVAGGTGGFIHGWKANEGDAHLFDLSAPQNHDMEFQVWEHDGPITCLALDFNRMYSGSWDMSCLEVLKHSDWVWNLAPHDTTLASTAGSDLYVWDINSGSKLAMVNNAHAGYTYSLARSHTGKLLFTGGEDGAIHMFEFLGNARYHVRRVATWIPHLSAVYSLAFEFPWLVSASSDGKLSLIDVRKLLRTNRNSMLDDSSKAVNLVDNVEPPQRMLHGFASNLFAVDVGSNRIVCAGEEGVVRIWNFSQALEIEQRVQALRGLRLENRMRRRNRQLETNGKKNQMDGDRNSWYNHWRRMVWKVKA
ncbi:unnamed protein product [Withania somnifera]